MKTILEDFKKEIGHGTVIVGDFNTPLSTMNRSFKQRINKDIVILNDTLDQMDLIFIYRTLHPKEAKYTLFSNVHGWFSKIDHIVGHKTSLNKFKKIEIIPNIFSDHNGLKRKTSRKNSKTFEYWRLNNMLLNNEWNNNEV